MFPFQHGDELVIEPPSVIKRKQILRDLTPDHTLLDNTNSSSSFNTSTTSRKKGQRRSSRIQENESGGTFPESDIRKLILHRDVERQRRQEMANLYASLQSHVPTEYLKGKKLIPNLLQEAVNYITDTTKNIKKLCLQRDKLKRLSNSHNLISADDVGSSHLVTVNSCLDGVEILISSNFIDEEYFPLSKVLKELLGRGFNVVNCVTTKANERSLHRIQCHEASNLKCNDLSRLQERLRDVINLGRETSN